MDLESTTNWVSPLPLQGRAQQHVWGFDSRPPPGSRRRPVFWQVNGRSRQCRGCRQLGCQTQTCKPQTACTCPDCVLSRLKLVASPQAWWTDKQERRCIFFSVKKWTHGVTNYSPHWIGVTSIKLLYYLKLLYLCISNDINKLCQLTDTLEIN